MKFKHSIIFMALLAITSMFASCSEGEYWDEYTEEAEKYSFVQSSSTLSFTPGNVPTEFKVEVCRNTTSGSVTLPITLESKDGVLTGPSSVTFNEGSNMAEYVFTVGEVPIGSSVSASLSFDENVVSVSGNSSYSLTISADYTWESAGSCTMISDWAGVSTTVPIQKAAEYNGNLYRLNSPYYYLEPDYCPKAGYHIQFYLDDNGNAMGMPKAQNIGEYVDGYGWFYYYYVEGFYDWCSFTNEGNQFTIKFIWAYGDDSGLGLYDYGQESFVWEEGYPGK